MSRKLSLLSLVPALVLTLVSANFAARAVQTATAKQPPSDVLGVRLGMGEAEARALLDRVGRRQVAERMKQDVWEVSDARVSHVIVRFKDKTVRWVIAQARAGAPERLRYSDLGDLAAAEHKTDGTNHTYQWKVPARGKQDAYLVVAGGRDPQFLTSYRILRVFD